MEWSFKKPTVTGYYWVITKKENPPQIADVQVLNNIVYYMGPTGLHEINSLEWLFAGPLIPPEKEGQNE